MARKTSSRLDIAIEAVKVGAGLVFLSVVFNDLTAPALVQNLFLDWHWGRFVTVAIAYYVSKRLFESGDNGKWPLWQCYLHVFYGACVLGLVVWAGYGTHVEDADPLFGGGTTVIDFVPSEIERDLVGSRVFFDVLMPALVGAYLAHRQAQPYPMPAWLGRSVQWGDLAIGSALAAVGCGAVYVGMAIGSGFAAWGAATVIVERAEVGWYLLWAIPLLLFYGAWFLLLSAVLPGVAARDWYQEWERRKRTPPSNP